MVGVEESGSRGVCKWQPTDPKEKPSGHLRQGGRGPVVEIDCSVGERAKLVRRNDNLKPEGELERWRKSATVWCAGERAMPVKIDDNLKIEGDFVKREELAKEPELDMGDIERVMKTRKHGNHPLPERITSFGVRPNLKREDNLHPKGEFVNRKVLEWKPENDRSDLETVRISMRSGNPLSRVRHPIGTSKDGGNLEAEGEFVLEPGVQSITGRRPLPIRADDNLKTEGECEDTTGDGLGNRQTQQLAATSQDAAKVTRSNAEAKSFKQRLENNWPRTERAISARRRDNLKPEGVFAGRGELDRNPELDMSNVERLKMTMRAGNPVDDIKELGRPKTTHFSNPSNGKHLRNINLKPEGDFTRRQKEHWLPVERPQISKLPDNLKTQGDFVKREELTKEPELDMGDIERVMKTRKSGNFSLQRSKSFSVILREMENRGPERSWSPGDQVRMVRRADNLRTEGEFHRQPNQMWAPAERAAIVRRKDNLRLDGDFEHKPRMEDLNNLDHDFHRRCAFVRCKRLQVQSAPEQRTSLKREDSLRLDGDFLTRSQEDVWSPGERATKIRHGDNLRMEGEFLNKRTLVAWTPGEAARMVRKSDNLKLSGEFSAREPWDRWEPMRERSFVL